MGVDYRAEFGIGYQVEATDDLRDLDVFDIEGLYEYLDNECGSGFKALISGNYYSGKFNGAFMVLASPFKSGIDLTSSKWILDEELIRLKVRPVGDFGVVGGLLVW